MTQDEADWHCQPYVALFMFLIILSMVYKTLLNIKLLFYGNRFVRLISGDGLVSLIYKFKTIPLHFDSHFGNFLNVEVLFESCVVVESTKGSVNIYL